MHFNQMFYYKCFHMVKGEAIKKRLIMLVAKFILRCIMYNI